MIWLDVTSSALWTRPAVGVLRTEIKVASRIILNGIPDIRFCIFDRGSRSFFELSRDEAAKIATRVRGGTVRTSDPPPTVVALPNPDPASHCPFSPGDAIVTLGVDWEHKDLGLLYELRRRLGLAIVSICYDIIPVKFPHLWYTDGAQRFRDYLLGMTGNSDHVLCISRCTQGDLTEFVRASNGRTFASSVITLGSELSAPEAEYEEGLLPGIAGRSYLLYVSTLEKRKNHEVIYRAYTRLVDGGVNDLPLVLLVGQAGWGIEGLLADLGRDPRVKGLFIHLDNVSDAQLATLYRNCLFTVYPSLYEGWGLPVAESLAYGKFCICSGIASLREVGGTLLAYADPWRVDEWAELLLRYSHDRQSLAKKEEEIRSFYRCVPWSQTTAQILQIARQCAGAAR